MKKSAAFTLPHCAVIFCLAANPAHFHPPSADTTLNIQHDALELASHCFSGLADSVTDRRWVSTFFPSPLYPALTLNSWGSLNLTISFFPATSDTCAVAGYNSAEVLTFTTANIPTTYCFNLADHFSSNTSIVDDSISHARYYHNPPTDDDRFRWRLYNANAYSIHTNYSRVWYQQRGDSPPADGRAQRSFFLYNRRDCGQSNSSGPFVDPIPFWTCESSEQGDCYQIPYDIVSFSVAGKDYTSWRKKCHAGWRSAAAKGPGKGTTAAAVGIVAMLVAGVLSW